MWQASVAGGTAGLIVARPGRRWLIGNLLQRNQVRVALAAVAVGVAAAAQVLFEVHADLGLGFVSEGTRVMASLTPVKEREIIIMGDVDDYARPGAFSGPFKRALFRALDTFINRMDVTAFNIAIYSPSLGETSEAWQGFPIIARLVDRGHPGDGASDVGAMELYAASVIKTDPFRVAEVLRANFLENEVGSMASGVTSEWVTR